MNGPGLGFKGTKYRDILAWPLVVVIATAALFIGLVLGFVSAAANETKRKWPR